MSHEQEGWICQGYNFMSPYKKNTDDGCQLTPRTKTSKLPEKMPPINSPSLCVRKGRTSLELIDNKSWRNKPYPRTVVRWERRRKVAACRTLGNLSLRQRWGWMGHVSWGTTGRKTWSRVSGLRRTSSGRESAHCQWTWRQTGYEQKD